MIVPLGYGKSERRESLLRTEYGLFGEGHQPEFPTTGQRRSVKVFGCVEVCSARFPYRRDQVFNVMTYLDFLEQVARPLAFLTCFSILYLLVRFAYGE
jgi:hypothetical protein